LKNQKGEGASREREREAVRAVVAGGGCSSGGHGRALVTAAMAASV